MSAASVATFAVGWENIRNGILAQFVLIAVFSAVGGLIPAAVTSYSVHIAPADGSVTAVLGLTQQIFNVGNFLGPMLFALLAASTGGWATTWWLTCGLSALGWPCWRSWEHRPAAPAGVRDPRENGFPSNGKIKCKAGHTHLESRKRRPKPAHAPSSTIGHTVSATPPPGLAPGSATSRDPRTWSPAKRNRYGWFITCSLLFLMMLSWADKAVLGIAAVPLMKQLGITPEQFGLVGSAMFLTFGVAQIVAAPIANKVSSKWILLVLCLLWSLAQAPILLFAHCPPSGPAASFSAPAKARWHRY